MCHNLMIVFMCHLSLPVYWESSLGPRSENSAVFSLLCAVKPSYLYHMHNLIVSSLVVWSCNAVHSWRVRKTSLVPLINDSKAQLKLWLN